MLNRPSQKPHKDLESQKSSLEPPYRKSQQDGFPVPIENLTHITAYLDPPSLFALSLVNKLFYEHIRDDHTWHRAFLLNFLGISPEGDIDNEKSLFLRRFESTWRKEYVFRHNLLRRWTRRTNSTIAHAPVHSPISSMHLLPGNSLLCASLQYGIVSRSVVFTGRVIRGFLSPSPSGTGLGIGNPNTEFSPNVTACAIGSEGGTAKIAWGFRSGEVAIMTAARTMETSSRSAAKLIRCTVEEQHDGEILHVAWDNTGSFIISTGKDGRVKIWEAKKVKCVWSSEYLVPDACIRAEFSVSKGYVVAAMRSGDLVLWTGLDFSAPSNSNSIPRGTRITCPADVHSDDHILPTITSIHLDPAGCILVAYRSLSQFYGIFFEESKEINIVRYYDPSFVGAGSITSLLPCYASNSRSNEISFVLAGDQTGCINVYPYGSKSTDVVSPIRKFEAHEDGSAVTALSWNGLILVSGAASGTTSVFDAFTLERLKTFPTPVPRQRGGRVPTIGNVPEDDSNERVQQIILGPEKDVLVVGVGSHVMGFKADPVPRGGKTKARKGMSGKKKDRGTTLTKGYDQHFFKRMVSESISELKQDNERRRRVHGREREQLMNLEQLGLDEVEAVEYVLMLSRDEALQRERGQMASSTIEEGVFEGDFDDIENAGENQEYSGSSASSDLSVPNDSDSLLSGSPSISRSVSAASLSSSPGRMSSPSMSISMSMFSAGTPKSPGQRMSGSSPRSSPSSSTQKIQVSPRYVRNEPLEAGFGYDFEVSPRRSYVSSSLSSSVGGHGLGGRNDVSNDAAIAVALNRENETTEHFPPILNNVNGSSNDRDKGKVSSKSAWKRPLGSVKLATSSNNAWSTALPGSSQHNRTEGAQHDDEDEDLKLAILLSLEDARRRGDVV
ncbi:hypothetical protein K435DRAFT_307343 [Dendrothele bispora CBS 962.96]|uniref:F-box domain-containing protein n=1 Tax=Dendrothele bispora (strain CBS 962.96) TaxID=1314807 RepID=A0A4V4HDV2_DENBC|nr:hypothetical protein K435DRAFT_307343 [Dendrothele bispora CBS 962.96]